MTVPKRIAFTCLIVMVILLSLPGVWSKAWAGGKDVVYSAESLYHSIEVYDVGGKMRYLACDGKVQSAMLLADPAYLYYPYVRSAISGIALLGRTPSNIAVVGLGGGTMAAYLEAHYPSSRLDVIELDPMVFEMAKEYFNFTPSVNTGVFIADARAHLRRSHKLYDIIILDAYQGATLPFHLTTAEFLRLVKSRLKPGGLVIGNYWYEKVNQYIHSQMRTYQSVFGELYLLDTGREGSLIFVAKSEKGLFDKKVYMQSARQMMALRGMNYDITDIIKTQLRHVTDKPINAAILTDDYAPVNMLKERAVNR